MKYILLSLVLASIFLWGCAKATDPLENVDVVTVERIYETVGIPEDMIITDAVIYVAEDQAGFSIFDRTAGALASRITMQDDFIHLSNIKQLGYAEYYQKLFVFDRYGPTRILVYSVEDIYNPQWIHQIIGGDLASINYLEINNYEDGNIELSIANTNSIFRYGEILPPGSEEPYFLALQQYPMPNAIRKFHIVDQYAYFAGAQRGMYIFDMESRTLLSELNMTGDALDIRVKGDYAYIVAKQEGLLIADISDKSNPVWLEENSLSTVGWAQAIDLESDYLVVGSGSGGVYLYDIGQDPARPRLLQRIPSSVVDYVLLVEIKDSKIFVAGRYQGITVLNINR